MQNGETDRLDQELIRPGLKGFDLDLFSFRSGEDHQVKLLSPFALAQSFAQGGTVYARHSPVGNDQLRIGVQNQAQSLDSFGRYLNIVARIDQMAL